MLLFCATLLINEVFFDPPGSDAGQEWVEVVNPGPFDVEASGWFLERAKSSWSVRAEFPEGTFLAAGERLLVGDVGSGAELEVVGGLDLGNASSTGDALRLVSDEGDVVDVLVYGPNNDDGFRNAGGQEAWPVTVTGGLLARVPDAVSTGSPADWSDAVEPTPGLPNRERDCDVARVRLNELLVDPAGADGDQEWVELYGDGDVVLDGWVIEASTRPSRVAEVLTLDGLELVAGIPLLVDGLSGLPNGAGGDAVRLVDCEGTVQDVVVYGDSSDDALLDGSGAPADPVPLGPPGTSLARVEDGAHSGVLSQDWWVPNMATPGQPNPMPPVCDAEGVLQISEVYPDPPGADDGSEEFVELVNTGGRPVSLSGWRLRLWTRADDSVSVPLPAGVVVAPGAVVVVGQERVIDVPMELPNGRGGDAVWLEDCSGRAVDAVAWGDSNIDEVPAPLGGVARVVGPPGAGRSLSRQLFGTSGTAEEWKVGAPTPGVLQTTSVPVADTLPSTIEPGCASTGSVPCPTWIWLGPLWMVRWRRKRR